MTSTLSEQLCAICGGSGPLERKGKGEREVVTEHSRTHPADFVAQGGDPTGTGEGGESIYSEPFKVRREWKGFGHTLSVCSL